MWRSVSGVLLLGVSGFVWTVDGASAAAMRQFGVVALAPSVVTERLAHRALSANRMSASTPQCRINYVTRVNACRDPVNGLGTVDGSPPMRTERAAVTARWKNGAILVKAAIANPAINHDAVQVVWSQIVVNSRPVVGTVMHAAWHFFGGVRGCSFRTDRWGIATCSEKPLQFESTDGDTIPIDVTFVYRNHVYSCRISYVSLSD